ncbi:hypothetical protein FO440_19935 [Mucilaginibacter corticis]|uniref:Pr6Pr family membrane protein n=1 Tax=Mucilaginibacter corticis TaxID=2597670 RepID=A0A556MFS9_9SPHI|nr:Pr6Pr family membrane protein [Mucilaginibacter corticis]TSJ38777.1 hypothetical protein FO440_19935 [Mucilaginibacter corticis]
MKNNTKAIYMAILAIMTWIGLCVQFYISTEKYMSQGRTFGGAIVQLLSYFTIQNNLLIALALTVLLLWPASKWGSFFSKLSVLSALTLYITIVCLVYQIVLRRQHTQHGLFKFCDEILHTLSPPLFVLFWLIFVDKGKLAWSKAFSWLIYPLIYFIFIIARGVITGYYPYSFIDGTKLNLGQIAVNFFFLLLTFLAIGLIYIGISRLSKKQT